MFCSQIFLKTIFFYYLFICLFNFVFAVFYSLMFHDNTKKFSEKKKKKKKKKKKNKWDLLKPALNIPILQIPAPFAANITMEKMNALNHGKRLQIYFFCVKRQTKKKKKKKKKKQKTKQNDFPKDVERRVTICTP